MEGFACPSTKSLGSISPNRYISGIRHIIGSIQNYDLMQMQGLNSMLVPLWAAGMHKLFCKFGSQAGCEKPRETSLLET